MRLIEVRRCSVDVGDTIPWFRGLGMKRNEDES